MLSIRNAIRLMRLVATAIRNRDFNSLWEVIAEIASAFGFDAEFEALAELRDAFASGDLQRILTALTNFIDIVSGNLSTPKLLGVDGSDPTQLADKIDAEADHLMMHCGHRGSTRAEMKENLPAAAVGVSPAVVLMILNAIMTAVRWWLERSKEEGDGGAFAEPSVGSE